MHNATSTTPQLPGLLAQLLDFFFLQIDAIRSKSTIKKVFKGKMPFRSSFYWVSKQVLNTILNIFSMLKKVR